MKTGEPVIIRRNATQVIGDGIVVEQRPTEKKVFVAFVGEKEIKVCDEAGAIYPSSFHLTENGVWLSSVGYYIVQEHDAVVIQSPLARQR